MVNSNRSSSNAFRESKTELLFSRRFYFSVVTSVDLWNTKSPRRCHLSHTIKGEISFIERRRLAVLRTGSLARGKSNIELAEPVLPGVWATARLVATGGALVETKPGPRCSTLRMRFDRP